ncbi:MAG: leucine-rich repeat domain-containing protein, partial [Treponema sp.]|nr:leucine-rich repeat domain-containing protein [Treponema sp.]
KATDSDFTVVQKNSTSTMAVLSADIYVAGTASTRKHCLSTATPTDSATTRGTASSPFASIKGAMYAVNADATTITVDGTLSDAQTIDGKRLDDSSIPTAVTAITIKGYKASSTATSSGMLDGGSNSSNKTMLTVNKSGLAVTIQDLTITRGNAANGGGINLAAGTVNLESGAKVSSNKATSGGSGAGVYVASGATLNIKTGSEIYSNAAYSGTINGGGVYNGGTTNTSGGQIYNNSADNGGGVYNSGTLTMTEGTIGASGALNKAGTSGGAIYQGGTFNISGSAYVYPGSETSNDVYLPSGNVVTINGNYNGAGNTASSQMALTPANWTRGSYVLGGASCNTTNAGYFKITDSEWEILKNNSTDKGRIDADIYVAPTSSTTTVNSVTYGKGAAATAGGRGTKAKPYSTIADAVAQCWGGPKDTGTGVSRVINIVGTITGAQEIASTVTTSKASGITLKGVNTSATLNGNMSSTSATKKSTLTISTAVPVTIQTLTVKGGYSSGNGGGILVNGVKGASLTLGENAKVTGNTATTNGGGIYFAGTNASGGTANLIMNSTSQISGNTANGTAATNGGGGVYLSYANLSMSGSALIGDTSGTTYATSGSTGHSNMAKNGGGVYLAAGGKLRLGYASAGATGGTNLSSTYGIRHNYASACGGGVYAVGSVDFAYGAVSCNGTAATSDCDGGGIWFGSASTLTMTGGTIANNKGCYGGGVYAGGTLSMSGGTIGDSSKTTAATSSSGYYSNSASYGGGIYAPNGSTLTLNGGYVSYNYASTSGGGIYSVSSNAVTFKANANFNRAGSNGGGMYIKNQISMTGGVIKGNCAVSNGGGVYMNGGNLYMSGSAVIGDSSKSDYAKSASACSNYALNNGGGVYLGDESYAYLGYTSPTSPINSFTGGIYYNYANNNGGGICDNPDKGNDVNFNGGSISYNGTKSSGFGGAVYLSGNSSTLTFRGSNTKIVAGSNAYYNTVYLDGAIIGVDASNSPTSTTIATIIPSSYSSDTKVMDYTSASSCAAKIKVWPTASDNWLVQNGGYIDKGSRVTSASDAAAAIQALSSGKSARIIIECSVSNASTFFSTIKAALVNSSACISLDLTGVTGLTEISNNAFYGGSSGCPSLYSIKLPSTITRIGTNAFAYCTNLGKYYNGSLTTSSTQTVFLPESCTEVGAAAFYNCYFNTMDLAHVNTLYTSACVGWSGTGNKTVTLARESGQTVRKYTGSSYTTLESGTYSLPLATTYYDYLGYGDAKLVRQ